MQNLCCCDVRDKFDLEIAGKDTSTDIISYSTFTRRVRFFCILEEQGQIIPLISWY